MATALVLAGHGSHISAQTAGLVWAHVDALRMLGVADEVTAAFWKETPSFRGVFDTLKADDITVVPLFTAQGYFTQTVIPAEMGLTGPLTRRHGRIIRYTRTLNEQPYLSGIVRQRVQAAMAEHRLSRETTAVAIIGHSTRRNPESRKATEAQAAHVRALGLAAQVEAVYLDDAPEIPEIYALTDAPNLVAVPYFLALGSHTTIDVPEALGLTAGASGGRVDGRNVIYTHPVGTDADLRDVIVELARDAGMPLSPPTPARVWGGFPSAGRAALAGAVTTAGALTFGQLRLTPDAVRVDGDASAADVIESPAALRQRVRDNPFRSLPTARDLPGGWHVEAASPDVLHAAVETIYPGVVADWAAECAGALDVRPLEQVVARQTGMYRRLEALSHDAAQAVVARVCGNCVRGPTWFEGATPAGRLPCPEACNHWLSAALEAL